MNCSTAHAQYLFLRVGKFMENYVLYGEISETGLCTVFKGRRKSTIQYVSIHRYSREHLETLTRNVSHLSRLDHAHILRFMEWYCSPQHVWIVTELVSAGTLSDVIDTDGPAPLETIPSFVSDILAGLNHAHTMGMVVRDLCPGKIRLDASGILKLSDFSLAVEVGMTDNRNDDVLQIINDFYSTLVADYSPNTLQSPGGANSRNGSEDFSQNLDPLVSLSLRGRHSSSSSLLSPFYLSPESVQSSTFSYASDLWSVGVIMYELWVGHCPFTGATPTELINSITDSDPLLEWRVRINEEKRRRASEGQFTDGGNRGDIVDSGNRGDGGNHGDHGSLSLVHFDVLSVMCGLLRKEAANRYKWNDLVTVKTLWN